MALEHLYTSMLKTSIETIGENDTKLGKPSFFDDFPLFFMIVPWFSMVFHRFPWAFYGNSMGFPAIFPWKHPPNGCLVLDPGELHMHLACGVTRAHLQGCRVRETPAMAKVALTYPLVNKHSYRKSPFRIGKSTKHVQFSKNMLNVKLPNGTCCASLHHINVNPGLINHGLLTRG